MTELKFLGNRANLKQSTWSKLASYPILNFLLHNTEYFNDFFTILNAIVFAQFRPTIVNL